SRRCPRSVPACRSPPHLTFSVPGCAERRLTVVRSTDRYSVRYHSVDRPSKSIRRRPRGPGRERSMATGTSAKIMESARSCLLADGYANLSTRKVAEGAGVPLSQIHYHFGGKQGMVLALLEYENQRLVRRQRQMYAADSVPLWKRYEQACD